MNWNLFRPLQNLHARDLGVVSGALIALFRNWDALEFGVVDPFLLEGDRAVWRFIEISDCM